jgi:NhaA family Na+:H+ antiporter
MQATIKNFLRLESAGGIVLMAAAVLALVAANSGAAGLYQLFIDTPVEVRVGALQIAKPLFLWVNDGLMAIFFFLVGLELKREFLEGELSRPANVLLPAIGAVGGMVVPVGIYLFINDGDPAGIDGWAIPAATDIAFALGILTLLGNRVPLSLKVFLVSLAIFDDLGAIVIIAIFYSADLSLEALIAASICLAILIALNRRGVMSISSYVLVGVIMWIAVLKSGVHATLAGVALAAFIPMRDPDQPHYSPLRELEHDLHRSQWSRRGRLVASCAARDRSRAVHWETSRDFPAVFYCHQTWSGAPSRWIGVGRFIRSFDSLRRWIYDESLRWFTGVREQGTGPGNDF